MNKQIERLWQRWGDAVGYFFGGLDKTSKKKTNNNLF